VMERIPESELMDEQAQARAYAEADFDQPHENFISLFKDHYFQNNALSSEEQSKKLNGNVLDLGCGPADVTIRFASHFPECNILAVDGAAAMLKLANKAVDNAGFGDRVTLQQAYLPNSHLPEQDYQVILSNSLLHHIKNPQSLWQVVKSNARSGTYIFVMDLMRPRDKDGAKELVEEHTGGESDVLKKDFYNSLLAAYTIAEVEEQLEREGLVELTVRPASDRHMIVCGLI
jgi:SAM-dependent methyltransferase